MPENQIKVQLNPDTMPSGSDLSVINAARKSFGVRSDWDSEANCPTDLITGGKIPPYKRLKEKDKRLIQFLARGLTTDDWDSLITTFNETETPLDDIDIEDFTEQLWKWRDTPEHDTPFNHMFVSFEIKAPIFVARQLVKHEYMPWSEYSRRYKVDDIEFYTPDVWRGKPEGSMKQGSSGESIWNHGRGTGYRDYEYEVMDQVKHLYLDMLKANVAPEQARMVLPQSTMTSWTWSGTFGAVAQMLRLRLADDTQYETRLVAQQMGELIKPYYPESYKALVEREFD